MTRPFTVRCGKSRPVVFDTAGRGAYIAPEPVNLQAMSRGYLVFGDIEGKLDVLRVECTRCPRKGSYSVRGLIEQHGRDGRMMVWKEGLNSDCPKREAPQLHDRCDLICPDLPKVI
jgi:hypothetical protein